AMDADASGRAVKVARDLTAIGDSLAPRLDTRALRQYLGTARGEMAAGGWVDHARRLALEHLLRARRLELGVGDGHRGEQRLGVGVLGIEIELIAGRQLDDLAEIHDGDAGADVAA